MSDILEKIRKLLALSKSPNEHEAAIAAAKAAALAAKYQVDLAILDISQDKPPRGYDVKVNTLYTFPGTRTQGWVWAMTLPVAEAHRLSPYSGHTLTGQAAFLAVGDPADAEVVSYLIGWLVGEVERLLVQAKPPGLSRAQSKRWCNGFRSGAAARIGERISQEVRDARARLTLANPDDYQVGLSAEEMLALDRKHRYALTLADKDEAHSRSIAAYCKDVLKLRQLSGYTCTSRGGYDRGRGNL